MPFKLDDMGPIYENIKYACTLGKLVEVGFVDIDMLLYAALPETLQFQKGLFLPARP